MPLRLKTNSTMSDYCASSDLRMHRMTSHPIGARWQRWVVLLGVWTLIGLSFARQYYVSSSTFGNPVTWRHALNHALTDWYLFALLSPPAIWLARKFAFERSRWLPHAALHLFFSAIFSISWMALRAFAGKWQSSGGGEPIAGMFETLFVKTFYFNMLIYWVIVSVAHTFDYYRKFHERELNSVELEKRLTQAKLQALQMQLNPHFLFNTLHAISALMHKDVEAADRMIARLSDLLRYALESTEAQEVPLQQELEFLEQYLEIEQTRFGRRLVVHREIDPATLNAKVPNLVLQPLVENAIRHGIEPQSKPGIIELRARRNNGRLELQVRDNGAGLSAGSVPTEGVGLSNTRSRLQQLYGDAQKLELTNAPDGGLIVSVTIPFCAETSA
jgi:two-component system LytT family sensor kinase